MRLLIVDDNPFVRKLFETRARQRSDVTVDLAASPEAALHLIHASKEPYDLVVCDEHLGVRVHDGGAFIHVLTALDLPVALVTDGVPPTETLAGRTKILMRPVSLTDLMDAARVLRKPTGV